MTSHPQKTQNHQQLTKAEQNQRVQFPLDQLLEQALALHQHGRLGEAKAMYASILNVNPQHFDALHLIGVVFHQLNDHQVAADFMAKAIEVNPKNTAVYINRGAALKELKKFDEALASYDKAISIKPDYAQAHYNRGLVLLDLKRLNEALASYDKALSLKPDYAEALNNRGNVLMSLKQLDEALGSYDEALSLRSDYAEAHYNRGLVLLDLKRLSEALASYDKALSLKPDYAEAFNNRSAALRGLKHYDESLASVDKALALEPDYAEAHNNRGNVLRDLKRLQEALASYDKALSIRPDYVEAHHNRGTLLMDLKRLVEAIASNDRALSIRPDYAEAFNNRGYALLDLKRLDEALASLNSFLLLKPDADYVLGTITMLETMICKWDDLLDRMNSLKVDAYKSKKVALPFSAHALFDDADLHKNISTIYAEDKYPTSRELGPILNFSSGGKIRVGYYSADFKEHPVSYLMAELFELHDRNKFEIIGFSLVETVACEITDRLIKSFDNFINVHDKSDREIAEISRNIGIDVAVDLGGYTKDCRTGIFSFRLAPMQVGYIGYLGTMGSEYYDYIIADDVVIPEQSRNKYYEKIAYIPSYQANDSKRVISEKRFTKRELSLPEDGFVFCCFNNNYKILPATFDGWMRILTKVDGSVLFLLADNKWVETNLKKEAEVRGVSGERLVFGSRLSYDAYLARYIACDLFLDTFPYNAGATASDALWTGLPVLTCMGKSFASRMAASLLTAIELPELITHTREDYEAKAIELATHPAMLQALKTKLEKNRLTTPLFNSKLFAKHIEAAYVAMYERSQAGLPPDNIFVQP